MSTTSTGAVPDDADPEWAARGHQLIGRIPHSRSYEITPAGLSTALFFSRLTRRIIIPALTDIAAPGPPRGSPLRQADRAYRQAIADLASQASLGIRTQGATKEQAPPVPAPTHDPS